MSTFQFPQRLFYYVWKMFGKVGRAMADGTVFATIEDGVETQPRPPGAVRQFGTWLVTQRSGLLTIWATAIFLSLVAVMTWQVFVPGVLSEPVSKVVFVGASALLWLPLLLLFLDSPDNLKKGPKLRLPAACLMLLASLASISIVDRALGLNWLESVGDETTMSIAVKVVFFTFLLVSFIPLVWNAVNFARHDLSQSRSVGTPEERQATEKSERDQDAEAISALLGTLIVLAIGALAISAGQLGTRLSFPNSFGLVLCGAVVGIFAMVVFIDSISEWAIVRLVARMFKGLARALWPLAQFYNWIDTGLVRIGANICGMGHRSTTARYVILTGQLSCLALLGWWLPAPYGLLPCFIAFVLAVSVSRLWSWVEEDRSLAAMTEYRPTSPYRIGFREDYRDETLLGFIFVFALVPIAMMQAHVGDVFGSELFTNADDKGFGSWMGYFGIELAKAVPIVDWAEIYNVSPGTDLIQMNGTASRHAVFLARVMVDLVLIAALLQAISITGRNRQQKRLYAAGHVKRLDFFVERLELGRAIKLSLVGQVPPGNEDIPLETAKTMFDLKHGVDAGAVDFRHYDEPRLGYLYGSRGPKGSGKDRLLRAFILLIAHFRGIPLGSAIDLTIEIAEGDRREMDMFRAFERAKLDHETGHHIIQPDELYLVLIATRATSGLKAFKFELIDMYVSLADPDTALEGLADLVVGKSADSFKYTRDYATKNISDLADRSRTSAVVESVGNRLKKIDTKDRLVTAGILAEALSKLRNAWKRLKEKSEEPEEEADG